ncbi:MAG: DUF2207 domain-containing protein, partial [Desulfovibrionaceae bacterium]|nr:DUF2207 domain-containing protein [Desulfovibrionaceae bacterium]
MTRFFRLPVFLTLLFLFPQLCLADPHQVLSLISEASLDSGGVLTVQESYRIQFQPGTDDFYRDVRYVVPRQGPKVAPKLLNLQMDGSDMSTSDVETPEEGVFRIHIRTEKPKTLPEGIHVLTIRYRLHGQAAFFDDCDKLTWDAAGTGRSFSIQELLYALTLPPGAADLTSSAGPAEGISTVQEKMKDGSPVMLFSLQRSLAPDEGLPVAVSWSKGIIAVPPADMQAARDRVLRIAVISGILLLIYFILALWRIWSIARKPAGSPSPEPPSVLSQTQNPGPRAMSPSELHFLTKRGNIDGKGLAATLLSLASQGFCSIKKNAAGLRKHDADGYTLKAVDFENSPAGCGENALLEHLRQQKSTTLDGEGIRSLLDTLSQALFKDCAPAIQHDVGPVWIGILLAIGSVWAILQTTLGSFILWPEEVYTFLMSVFVLACLAALFLSPGFWRMGLAAKLVIIFLFFFLASLTYDSMETVLSLAPKWMLTASIILLILPLPFFFLIRLPVAQARQRLAEAKRFALFISQGPGKNASEDSLEQYSALGPYAAALGLEETWKQHCGEARAKDA